MNLKKTQSKRRQAIALTIMLVVIIGAMVTVLHAQSCRTDSLPADPQAAVSPGQTNGDAGGAQETPAGFSGRSYEPEGAPQHLSSYDMELVLDAGAKTLTGTMTVSFYNGYAEALDQLGFHLYPNAYSAMQTAPFEPTDYERAYPNGFSPGNISVHAVRSAAGENLGVRFDTRGDQMMYVKLKSPVQPQQRAVVEIAFSVAIPNCYGRFGYGEHSIDLAQFYPVLAVYENGAWRDDEYGPIGDPFYSETADYRVRLTVPRAYEIGSTGVLLSRKEEGGFARYIFDAPAVRDYAFFASDQYKRYEATTDGGVKVISLGWDRDGAKRALDAAAASIELFSHQFGAYPYKEFTITQNDFYIGGMEYPNIVQMDARLYDKDNAEALEMVTAHEVAHQWWYQLVGNDQVNEPWLDEALTQYSTNLYYRLRYGPEQETGRWVSEATVYEVWYGQGHLGRALQGDPIDLPAEDYPNSLVYSALVYSRGAMMFRDLERELGEEVFRDALRLYYNRLRYYNATRVSLYEAVKDAAGKDMAPWIDGYLRRGGILSGAA